MPDKWEYPWYACLGSSFPLHLLGVRSIPILPNGNLFLMTREWYMHPNGQLPAYEWNFSIVNPPVHAWAAFRVYQIDAKITGKPDKEFLRRNFS